MQETIRTWYRRTTRRAIVSLWIVTSICTVGSVVFYVYAPSSLHLELQVFNGAVTIPVAAAIWIASFILVWLLPMRETAFRSQEAMERVDARLEDLDHRVRETLDRVDRVAEKAEAKLDKVDPERFEADVAAIRRRVERDTEPLPVRTRGGAERADGRIG